MRIARLLAMAGIDSRRKCEAFISAGHVIVNGEKVLDLGRQVDPEADEVMFRGRHVQLEKFVYYVVNKPRGYMTTAADPHAEKTVYDLLPARLVSKTGRIMEARTRVFPVGRLDRDTAGLLLFTNDGDLAHKMTHPRYGVGKWYEVRLDRALDPRDAGRLTKGVQLKDGPAHAERVHRLTRRILRLLIREGRNRIVRRLFEALGYEVVDLTRIAFGPILIGQLPLGEGRFLSSREVISLREAVEKSKEGQKKKA